MREFSRSRISRPCPECPARGIAVPGLRLKVRNRGFGCAILPRKRPMAREGQMSICLRRREFIAAFGGAAAWPLAARAQQGDRVRRIGVLMSFDENDPEVKARLFVFTRALAGLGWTDGRNVRMDLRWAGGGLKRKRGRPQGLGCRPPAVIAT